MPLQVGQLIYTSFVGVGFRVLASPRIPTEIQHFFRQNIVHRYWDAYAPPNPGYRAAYLQQLRPEQTLFGWLYNDGTDEFGRGDTPYFIAYYLSSATDATDLNIIFDCLERGPIALMDRHGMPQVLDNLCISESCNYQPAYLGVKIPPEIRNFNHTVLAQGKHLNGFIGTELQDPIEQQSVTDIEAVEPLKSDIFQRQVLRLLRDNEQRVEQAEPRLPNQPKIATTCHQPIPVLANAGLTLATPTDQAERLVRRTHQMPQEQLEIKPIKTEPLEDISSIQATFSGATTKAKHLELSAQKIAQIVGQINDLSAQMNQQAINASINAGQSVDVGQRSVVSMAETVRSLSYQISLAAAEIDPLVSTIKTDANTVVAELETGTQQLIDRIE